MTVAYSFDVEVRHCKFCECYNSLGVIGCLRFWLGKFINVFYFRTKEKEKEKKHSNCVCVCVCVRIHNL